MTKLKSHAWAAMSALGAIDGGTTRQAHNGDGGTIAGGGTGTGH